MKTAEAVRLGGHFYLLGLKQKKGLLLQLTYGLMFFCLLLFSLFHGSIQTYLQGNLAQMLGADAVISLPRAMSEDTLARVSKLSSEVSQTQLVDLTISHKENWQRVQLKVVDAHYPLQGNLVISRDINSQEMPVEQAPEVGNIWLDPRLFRALNAELGEQVTIGQNSYAITGILHHEPDRLTQGHSVEMRAIITREANASAGTNNPWAQFQSRYRYLLNLPEENFDALQSEIKTSLPDASLVSKSGNHPLATFWQRSENFMGLSSVLIFILGALAIDLLGRGGLAQTSRRFALFKSMGTSTAAGLIVVITEWVALLVVGLAVGTLGAVFGQNIIIAELQSQLPGLTAQLSLFSLLKVFSLLFVMFALFQLPGWLLLSRVSINRLLREQQLPAATLLRTSCILAGLAVLVVFYTDNVLLSAMTVGALVVTCMLVSLITWLSLTVGARWLGKRTGLLPLCLFLMKQRMVSKTAQILGVGLCATLLLFSFVLMEDIGKTMERYQRAHDGNFFVSRLEQSKVPVLEAWSEKNGSKVKQLKPFYSASVTAVNGTALNDMDTSPSESKTRLERPIRVHWTQDVPKNNRVTEGEWWAEDDQDWQQVSVEAEVMEDLGLVTGDKVTFSFNGQLLEFTVVASHVFKPGNGSVTFWFQVPFAAASHIDAVPYVMGAMEVPQQNWQGMAELWQQLPSMRAVSLKELTSRFDSTLALVKKAISGFTLMIALAGIIVIFTTVAGFEASERTRNGLMLSFGNSKGQCLRITLYEWIITALIAAMGALCGTWLLGMLIYQSQFSMPYQPEFKDVLVTLLTILGLVSGAGMLAARSSLNVRIKTLIETPVG